MRSLIIAFYFTLLSVSKSETPTPYSIPHFYPEAGIVRELDFTTDSVIFETANGNLWSFNGIEDWCIDDQIAVIMYDNGTTETIHDDVIISARYCSPINIIITY